jgi:excinuclease ABC subunit C
MINLSDLPSKPGVYLFKNKKGEIIYIGKALSLKHRVKSYFQDPQRQEPKIRKMVQEIAALEHIETSSDFQALLLEAKLIKQHEPKYNTRLKDNKRYLYIAILKSPFPHLKIVRRPELEGKLIDWFGPFPSASAARNVLKIIRKVFPYCSCSTPRPSCLYVHLNLCPGPKALDTSKYRETVRKIRKVLNGNSGLLLRTLKKKMKKAAENLEFEEAAKIKKQIENLSYITRQASFLANESPIHWQKLEKRIRKMLVRFQKIEPIMIQKIEGYDVSNLGKDIIAGVAVAFVNGEPEKSLYRKFNIKNYILSSDRRKECNGVYAKQNDPAGIKQIIARRLKHKEWIYPQLILVDGGKPQVAAAFEAIKEEGLESQIAVLGLAKREEIIVIPKIEQGKIKSWALVKRSPRSPILQLFQRIRDESHRFAQKYYKTLHRRKIG